MGRCGEKGGVCAVGSTGKIRTRRCVDADTVDCERANDRITVKEWEVNSEIVNDMFCGRRIAGNSRRNVSCNSLLTSSPTDGRSCCDLHLTETSAYFNVLTGGGANAPAVGRVAPHPQSATFAHYYLPPFHTHPPFNKILYLSLIFFTVFSSPMI